MTIIGECVVCKSMAMARCLTCGASICDPVCRDAHKSDHNIMSPAPRLRTRHKINNTWNKRKFRKAA